jgi:hypothetical protein
MSLYGPPLDRFGPLRGLLQPPSRGLSVRLVEKVDPAFLQDGVLHGQFHMAHSDEAFEPTLDVTAFEEATSSRRGTSRAVHHVDPLTGWIAELLALLNIASAFTVKFVFERHLVLPYAVLVGCISMVGSSFVTPHLPFPR